MFFISSFCFHLLFHLDKAHEESALKRLRRKAKEKEVERKFEAFRKEYIKKESTKQSIDTSGRRGITTTYC
jgi:hypothetical protein